METTIAILMADLSGYTALTEVHGAETAASLVDRFLEMVNHSLVGDARLQERAGDQVMIISSSAEQLAYTANFLFDKAHDEEGFLPLHGGMHYGPVIQKNKSYFGSAINTAARLMATAEKGKMLCSKEFIDQLPADHTFIFSQKGTKQFKNLMQQVEVFEMHCCVDNITRQYVIDPVCHMLIREPAKARQLEHEGELKYFCSEKCMEMYRQLYMKKESSLKEKNS